jgi:hypothetical protein
VASWLGVSLLVAALPGCNRPAAEEPGSSADAKTADPTAAKPESSATAAGADSKAATSVVAIEAPSTEPAPSYPSDLMALLDLIPTDEETYVAIRDPSRLVTAMTAMSGIPTEGLVALLQALGFSETSSALMADAIVGISSVLEGSAVELERGVLVLPQMGEGAVVYAASKPDALIEGLARASKTEPAMKCGAVSGAPGYVSCGAAEDDPSFAAGKQAAERSKVVAAGLVGLNLDRAYVAGRVRLNRGTVLSMSIEPSGDQAVVSITLPPQIMGARQLGPRPPGMLSMMKPGDGFLWGSLSDEGLKRVTRKVPPVAAGPVGSLVGEFVLGTVGDPPGALFALGIDDPAPLRSTMKLLEGQLASLPRKLDDGSKLTVEARKLEVDGGTLDTIFGSLEGNKALAPLAEMGLDPSGYLFVSDSFAAAYVGSNEDTVKALAADKGTGPTDEQLAMLPPAARADLADNRVSILAHVPLDGLSTDAFRAQAKDVSGQFSASGVDRGQLLEGVLATVAPLSSMTMWVRHEGKATALRVAVSPFGSPGTTEGDKATRAVSEFLSGGDASDVFGVLATEFADSERASSYQIRAGQQPKRAMSSTVMVLIMAATLGYGVLAPSEGPPALRAAGK